MEHLEDIGNSFVDMGSLHHYRTEIPNIIFRMKLDPLVFKAYCVFKMTAGDRGACFKSNKTLAEEIGCSIPTIIKIKEELQVKDLVMITKRTHDNGGSMPDLIQIIDIWPQNMQEMAGKKNSNFNEGGKPALGGGVKSVNQGSKPALHKQEHKEEEQKEQQQQNLQKSAAAAFSEKKDFIQDPLQKIDIPSNDKIEISARYDEPTVKNAIAWATHPKTKITKGLAPAIKWACQNKPELPKEKPAEAPKVLDCSPYNRVYFREIAKISHKNGFRLHSYGVVEKNEYIETDNNKIYFKDIGFLEQISNFIRKKSIECKEVFDVISQCRYDLQQQQT